MFIARPSRRRPSLRRRSSAFATRFLGPALLLVVTASSLAAQEPEREVRLMPTDAPYASWSTEEHLGPARWAGDIELGERTYRLETPGGANGRLTAIPDLFRLYGGQDDPRHQTFVPVSRWVQVNEERFALAFGSVSSDRGPAYTATLAPVESAGETCRFTGRDVTSLTLAPIESDRDSVHVFLDELPATVSLPPGSYRYTLVLGRLRAAHRYGGSAREETVSAAGPLIARGTIAIERDGDNEITLGPPLDNRITVRRVGGRILEVDHAVVGGAGEEYTLIRRPDQGLTFTVRSGGEEVGSGAFRYG